MSRDIRILRWFKKPMSQTDVHDITLIDRAAISRSVKQATKRGYLEKVGEAKPRYGGHKMSIYLLTRSGEEYVEASL